ncbi:Protein of unknown function (DUF3017) [Isoptericola sp. CG 20/1183]|uniref:DUF3017 domain-containing protein n=1 Tax=Isoptericola halotolerans TaxID=300560 RepID=A0ABX5EGR5_9MICO|nr:MULTISPECIES: DUF3017 domain-containing protein [Isoptericola]MCK0118063.1 DUF3017 domain-containing protein [Isoptericola sp. S6320L]PRZ06941.1 Protein of unknown function (DUF3017) [Isoptericola halotolerans]PRZ07387.1 Protein of unknown function (DUF3017) [Isoptericola sp. CG 20/1183]
MVPDADARAQPHWHAVDAAPHAGARPVRSPVPAILVVLAGIVLAVLLGMTVGARLGSLTIAATLAVAGVWRAVSPSGPVGLAIRSRGFDVFLCLSVASVMGVLALTAPGV